MDLLLSLLLQLQHAQMQLSQLQSSRSARIEVRHRSNPVLPVAPVSAPTPVISAPTPVVIQPAPVQTIPAKPDTVSQIEAYVLADTNAFRAQNGLAALTADAQVALIARTHSADMLANNYFEHSDRTGCNPGCRLTNAGYRWNSYGENIHWMSGYKLNAADSAQKIVNDWINSPGHRANMLGAFTYAGVGIAINGDTVYTTTDYTTK